MSEQQQIGAEPTNKRAKIESYKTSINDDELKKICAAISLFLHAHKCQRRKQNNGDVSQVTQVTTYAMSEQQQIGAKPTNKRAKIESYKTSINYDDFEFVLNNGRTADCIFQWLWGDDGGSSAVNSNGTTTQSGINGMMDGGQKQNTSQNMGPGGSPPNVLGGVPGGAPMGGASQSAGVVGGTTGGGPLGQPMAPGVGPVDGLVRSVVDPKTKILMNRKFDLFVHDFNCRRREQKNKQQLVSQQQQKINLPAANAAAAAQRVLTAPGGVKRTFKGDMLPQQPVGGDCSNIMRPVTPQQPNCMLQSREVVGTALGVTNEVANPQSGLNIGTGGVPTLAAIITSVTDLAVVGKAASVATVTFNESLSRLSTQAIAYLANINGAQ